MRPNNISRISWLRYNWYFILEHFLGYKKFQYFFGKKRQRLYQTILEKNRQSKVVTNQIKEFNSEVSISSLKKNRKIFQEPIIFRNAASNWPAYKKWDLDFFEAQYGDREVLLNDLVGIVDPNNPQTFQKVSLKEYIDLMREGSLKYLKFSSLVQKEKALQHDLDLTWLKEFDLPLSFGRTFYMFVGGEGTITPLHNEFPSVVYAQVKGRKKWVMYLPEERIFLDPRTERKTYFYSDANPKDMDNKDFPIFKFGRKYEFILEPGDVLWFPPFAWHHVENLSESIGVAYKFANVSAGFRSSKLLASLFFMATKPNLLLKFFASRFKKDDYTLIRSEEESN